MNSSMVGRMTGAGGHEWPPDLIGTTREVRTSLSSPLLVDYLIDYSSDDSWYWRAAAAARAPSRKGSPTFLGGSAVRGAVSHQQAWSWGGGSALPLFPLPQGSWLSHQAQGIAPRAPFEPSRCTRGRTIMMWCAQRSPLLLSYHLPDPWCC